MVEKMKKKIKFTENEIIKILRTVCMSLEYLHQHGLVHCDLKIENCLFFDYNTIKLCDFGSINTFDFNFKEVPPKFYLKYEEIFEKQTTLMYRPPEMCDPYKYYQICTKVDI
jgi:AP2-associated kinase